MLILILMALGVLVGARFFPAALQKYNSRLQMVCTAVLIFAMGVSLGSRPDFFTDLQELGWESFLFALIPVFFSTLLVYLLSRLFLEKRGKK